MDKIIGVERLRIGSDGNGVTTLIGFLGCTLKCHYCLNPQCHKKESKCFCLSPKQLYDSVQRDEVYFRMSGGGVVFGGGEPLLHSRYIKKFSEYVAGKWEMRIETSLNVRWKHIERLIDVVDEWIIDIKDADSEIYKRYTGKDNKRVIDNCKKLAQLVSKDKIHIRIPYIPGYNTEEDVKRSSQFYENYGRIESLQYMIERHFFCTSNLKI